MANEMSERYKKALVTVIMGLRTEDDIKKNGLYRFTKKDKRDLLDYVTVLFHKRKSVLALKIKQTGFRSEHINIDSEEALAEFKTNVDNIFGDDCEIWIVSSSVNECWRCRIYLSSDDSSDRVEMAYSFDDHILDHINSKNEAPYIYYKVENNKFSVTKTNLPEEKIQETLTILKDIYSKYNDKFKSVKQDLEFIGVNGISLDVRVNDGYDFHDFDVSYQDVSKIINFYLPQLKS